MEASQIARPVPIVSMTAYYFHPSASAVSPTHPSDVPPVSISLQRSVIGTTSRQTNDPRQGESYLLPQVLNLQSLNLDMS